MDISSIRGIDAPIVDILERLNSLGYITVVSCCGFDYRGQGVRDHTNAHIIFNCNFNSMERLYVAVRETQFGHEILSTKPLHMYWSFEYLGNNNWEITHGTDSDIFDEDMRPRYQRSLIEIKIVDKKISSFFTRTIYSFYFDNFTGGIRDEVNVSSDDYNSYNIGDYYNYFIVEPIESSNAGEVAGVIVGVLAVSGWIGLLLISSKKKKM